MAPRPHLRYTGHLCSTSTTPSGEIIEVISIVRFAQQTCKAGYWQSVAGTVGYGTIVSLGFQNYGNASNFWVSQMFPESATRAYWQVVNNSTFTSTDWVPIAAVEYPDEETAAKDEPRCETQSEPLTDKPAT
jgi:hypothetical protein